jgi:hypothetical protein
LRPLWRNLNAVSFQNHFEDGGFYRSERTRYVYKANTELRKAEAKIVEDQQAQKVPLRRTGNRIGKTKIQLLEENEQLKRANKLERILEKKAKELDGLISKSKEALKAPPKKRPKRKEDSSVSRERSRSNDKKSRRAKKKKSSNE